MIEDAKIISYFTCKEDGNMSFSREPSRKKVQNRFRAVAKKLGVEAESMVCGHQTHGMEVGLVTSDHRGSGIFKPLIFDGTDALITNIPGIALCTVHADCIPIQLWDPEHEAIATVHSGWKGTLEEIAFHTVCKMVTAFGSRPEGLTAAIGPGICQSCFCVSADVQEAFCKKYPALCRREEFLQKSVLPEK